MEKFSDHSRVEPSAEISRLLYKAHYKGAVIRSLASAVMWLFALAAFLTHLMETEIRRCSCWSESGLRIFSSPSLKAVVCSGYDQDPVIRNYEQYGFKAALTKPFQLSDLKECLSRIMGKA